MMKENRPFVSIGLPVYNGEKYLEQTLDSILAQTFTDFELIISDNASTDRTHEICQSYLDQDRRIRFFRAEKNLGAAPNFNRVFNLSSGEYFKWAAHDDLIAPEFLSSCVKVLDSNPSLVLCFPRAKIIDDEGTFLGEHEFKADTRSPKPHIRYRNLVLTPDMGWQVFGLIRASVLRKTSLHGSYPASDLVLLAELSLHGDFYEIPERLLFPRYHPGQATIQIPVERNRTLFYDTSLEAKILLPKWLYLSGYLKAIRNAPLNNLERVYCYFQTLRWIMKPDHFRAMGKDVLLAAKQLLERNVLISRSRGEIT
jgi:glycosyltransferase involved in cell wall biosynthesis